MRPTPDTARARAPRREWLAVWTSLVSDVVWQAPRAAVAARALAAVEALACLGVILAMGQDGALGHAGDGHGQQVLVDDDAAEQEVAEAETDSFDAVAGLCVLLKVRRRDGGGRALTACSQRAPRAGRRR